jgi:hypothetical protein
MQLFAIWCASLLFQLNTSPMTRVYYWTGKLSNRPELTFPESELHI